jgi:hypothetical protein
LSIIFGGLALNKKVEMDTVVSSISWAEDFGEFFLAQAEIIEGFGYQHRFFRFDERIPQGSQIVFMQRP